MTQPAGDNLFQHLLELTSRRMARVARGITHDRQLAEDVCQDGYMELQRALRRGTPITNYEAWLHTVIINKARAAVSARQAPGEDTPALIDTAADVPADPQALLDSADHLDLQQAIEELPADHRTVATLRLFSGLTCRQIAAQLGCCERTVQVRLREALGMLTAKLGGGSGVQEA